MRITKRQLRRIIREAVLREGAKEDVMAYYGEIADMHSDSDAMGDLLDDLTDADLVAAGWEGGKDEAENYEDDFAAVVNALTPETLNRLVTTMDPEDLASAKKSKKKGPPAVGEKFNIGDTVRFPHEMREGPKWVRVLVTGELLEFIGPSGHHQRSGGGDDSKYVVHITDPPDFGQGRRDGEILKQPAWQIEEYGELVK
jgi:hypothetical protein